MWMTRSCDGPERMQMETRYVRTPQTKRSDCGTDVLLLDQSVRTCLEERLEVARMVDASRDTLEESKSH